jgi:hypothetical protein
MVVEVWGGLGAEWIPGGSVGVDAASQKSQVFPGSGCVC